MDEIYNVGRGRANFHLMFSTRWENNIVFVIVGVFDYYHPKLKIDFKQINRQVIGIEF